MEEKWFYRILFMGIILSALFAWNFFFPIIEPYPVIEFELPELPELPNPRNPRTWDDWIPEFVLDPFYIYLSIGITIIIIIIAIIAYYRQKEER